MVCAVKVLWMVSKTRRHQLQVQLLYTIYILGCSLRTQISTRLCNVTSYCPWRKSTAFLTQSDANWEYLLYSHWVYSCSKANSAGVSVTHLSWLLIVFRPRLYIHRAFPVQQHTAGSLTLEHNKTSKSARFTPTDIFSLHNVSTKSKAGKTQQLCCWIRHNRITYILQLAGESKHLLAHFKAIKK